MDPRERRLLAEFAAYLAERSRTQGESGEEIAGP
jgi:hypothetical protein